MQIKMWRERRRVLLGGLVTAVLIGAGVLAWWVWQPSSAQLIGVTVEGSSTLIRSWGAWGVVGSIGLMVAHSFLPFPAEVVAIANGIVYGPAWGTVITWLGAMLGASAAFGLARRLRRPFVMRVLSRRRTQQLAVWSDEHGTSALLIARLVPLIAFNLINYAAALTRISWWTFLWTTGVGILPFTIVLNVVGDQILTLPLWSWLILGAIAGAVWLALRRTRLGRISEHKPLEEAQLRVQPGELAEDE